MNGFRRDLTKERDLQVNQGLIEYHMDDACYRRDFGAAEIAFDAGARLDLTGTQIAVVNLPKGVVSRAEVTLLRPALWTDGQVALEIVYTSSTSSVLNFQGGYSASAYMATDPWNAGPVLVTVAFGIPGAAVATRPLSATMQAMAINPLHGMLRFRFRRDGTADAHGGDMLIGAMRLTYTPARRNV